MLIKEDVGQFIKSDCEVTVGSEGLNGDRLLIISPGSTDAKLAKGGQQLGSVEPVETDAIIANLQVTSRQFEDIVVKINSVRGTLGRLIQDTTIAENLNQTMINLKESSWGLDENMEALKHNFLFRGYYKKLAKKAEKLEKDSIEKAVIPEVLDD